MASFSTIGALTTLVISIPAWTARLDELNGQIAQRQLELARLAEEQRPPIRRSLRNKGSSESLRPDDGPSYPKDDGDERNDVSPIEASITLPESSLLPGPSPAIHTPPAAESPSALEATSQPSPGLLTRQLFQPSAVTPPYVRTVLRKRKTDSVASVESVQPKYRTRSMIIVYYDSTVQTAFEELVRFVSGSRNAMRKGKMALKMAEMRKAAALENDDGDEDGFNKCNLMANLGGGYLSSRRVTRVPATDPVPPLKTDEIQADQEMKPSKPKEESGSSDDEGELNIQQLKFVSARQMGPPRSAQQNQVGASLNLGMLRGYRRAGPPSGAPDCFDELDKCLEWCQSQCEHAAHQFLREGDCSADIQRIKAKLSEVVSKADVEVERLKKEEATTAAATTTPSPIPRQGTPELEMKSRSMRSIHMRRDKKKGSMPLPTNNKLEMEIDEGVDDMDEVPPILEFRRSRDMH